LGLNVSGLTKQKFKLKKIFHNLNHTDRRDMTVLMYCYATT